MRYASYSLPATVGPISAVAHDVPVGGTGYSLGASVMPVLCETGSQASIDSHCRVGEYTEEGKPGSPETSHGGRRTRPARDAHICNPLRPAADHGCTIDPAASDVGRVARYRRSLGKANAASTSAAARWADSMAPSMYPVHATADSAPAQCNGPTGSRMAGPNRVSAPGLVNAP